MKSRDFIKEYNNCYKRNTKLAAVRLVKESTGLGLREAKDITDINWYSDGKQLPGKNVYNSLTKENKTNIRKYKL